MNAVTIIALIPDFLRALSAVLPVLGNKAAAIGSPFITVAEEVLSAGAALIERGEEGAGALAALTGQITAMGTSDPTSDQWAQLKAQSDAAHASIQASEPLTPQT